MSKITSTQEFGMYHPKPRQTYTANLSNRGPRNTRQPTLGGGRGSLGTLGGTLSGIGSGLGGGGLISLGGGLGGLGGNIPDHYGGRGPTRFCPTVGSMLASPTGGRREISTRSQGLGPRNTSNVMRRLY